MKKKTISKLKLRKETLQELNGVRGGALNQLPSNTDCSDCRNCFPNTNLGPCGTRYPCA